MKHAPAPNKAYTHENAFTYTTCYCANGRVLKKQRETGVEPQKCYRCQHNIAKRIAKH